MKKTIQFLSFTAVLSALIIGCSTEDIRNISGPNGGEVTPPETTEVIPVDINIDGFDFMEKMQGHWVGNNLVINDEYPFFAWDYRAISPSHTFGIHEGGSAGNLLTSFFVTNFKGKRTIMARNGGLLNGIYRTSYFVLDKVENRNNGRYYRLVDAIGGDGIMYMELRFPNSTDSLYFNSYTSGLGNRLPNRHMTFKGKRMHLELAETAATATGYPQNIVDTGLDFANGFNTDYLYVKEGLTEANSATFLAVQETNNIFELAPQSGDPYIITDHPQLGYLQVDIERGTIPTNQSLLLFLSRDPFTDANGYFTSNLGAYNTALHYPILSIEENQFLMTYMHPGTYYVTVVADTDGDFSISEGDITHTQRMITIEPLGEQQITIDNITIQN
ncbi:hypothetical protein [Olleya sp. UBA1516]|uniref:hypothetical protein n=1 Tax=Olleya sp. UBA1516 TaxID=1947013 RepID=UPI0025F4B2FC|nr:hypothetical protein [Olleya sp. UBA1516]|tara:strand:- start:47741 stop:48904 length:1164 start_codon:yes stop_codon:yes gene_type:complete